VLSIPEDPGAEDAEVGSGEPSEPGEHVAAVTAAAQATAPAVRKRGKICPTCGQRYGAEAEFCGKDGTSLVMIN